MLKEARSRPVLTVSIAAYNAEAFLHVALDSCLVEENTGRLEVIIVDDGSTDGTGVVADGYASMHPDLFRVIHKQNGNYGSAMNASLPEARGSYYRLLDSDDWFDAEGLPGYLDVLEKCHSDICCTISKRLMAGRGIECLIDPAEGVAAGEYLLDTAPIEKIPGPGISNLTYRTDFLREICFEMLEGRSYVDEELRIVPWLRAATLRIDHIPVYCVLKERDGQSTSLAGIRRGARDKRAVLEHLLSCVDLASIDARPSGSQALNEICDVAIGSYLNLLLLEPGFSVREEIREMDLSLRKTSEVLYRLTGKRSRLIRVLRLSKFALYPLAVKHRLRGWQHA